MTRTNHRGATERMIVALIVTIGISGCVTPERPMSSSDLSCPSWVREPVDSHGNDVSPNLGCSNTANLAATIENSDDLQHGRVLGAASGGRESLAITRYQTGQVPPLQAAAPAAPTIVFSGSGAGTGATP